MELTAEQIASWVGGLLWPFIRFSALFLAAPFFSARTIPVRARIILAFFLAMLVQPFLPPTPEVDPLSAQGLTVALQQVSIGIVMGFILQLTFAVMVLAGQNMAMAMGLGFASTIDPQNGVQVTTVGQFYVIISNLFFLAVDGHLMAIEILVDSFQAFPVGSTLIDVGIFHTVVLWASKMFATALLLALPIVASVLLVNLAFGVLMRTAPQLNIFAVGFPMTIFVGYVLMYLSVPVMDPVLTELFDSAFMFMRSLFN